MIPLNQKNTHGVKLFKNNFLVWFFLFEILGGGAFPGVRGEEPEAKQSGLVTQVEVREQQIVITAWPSNGDPSGCSELKSEDFQIEVGGKNAPILGFYPLFPQNLGATLPPSIAPKPPKMNWVILIDEFHHSCPACWTRECKNSRKNSDSLVSSCVDPVEQLIHRHDVYESARKMLRDSFQPGDQVLIAIFRFIPMAQTGWLSDPNLAIEALDTLERNEKNRVPWSKQFEHVFHWYDGMISFINAIGQIPGPKELIFPTCHFPGEQKDFSDVRLLSSTCAKNQVIFHTVDVSAFPDSNNGLDQLALQLGGQHFKFGQGVSGAATAVRRMAGCRFLVFFRPVAGIAVGGGKDFKITCRKSGFNILGPSTVAGPGPEKSPSENAKDLFLLAALQRGLGLDVSLLPQEPSQNKWKGLATVQIRKIEGNNDFELPSKLILDLVVWQGGGKTIERHHEITGSALTRLFSLPQGHTVAFEIEIPPGEVNVTAILQDNEKKPELCAVSRQSIVIPSVAEAEKNGLWFPVRRSVRTGNDLLWLPNFQRIDSKEPLFVLGRICKNSEKRSGEVLGQFLKDGEAAKQNVLFERFAPQIGHDNCQWVLGRTNEPLSPGRWRFEPFSLGKEKSSSGFWIRVQEGN